MSSTVELHAGSPHPNDVASCCDVGCRIATNQDEIGSTASDNSSPIGKVKDVCGCCGRGSQRFGRAQSCPNEQLKLSM